VTCALVGGQATPVIGTAMPGSGVWVLRDDLTEAAVGELGELCVSGPQVARGYTASLAKTPNGFTAAKLAGTRGPTRIYRTGDRCRRDASGVLEFCGRDDQQVMLNGYRIELGEVVSALRACPGVLDATAELRPGDDDLERALVAQVVLADGASIPGIRNELSLRIPRHMIPALLSVPALGQSADPPAEASDGQIGRSSVRALVAGLWQQILGVEDVSDEADFFELGGDSQLATRLVVSLRDSLLPDLPIRVIFENPDFDGFCSAIETIARDAERIVKAGP
jgi:acyl-coenzyme A synthetase/AMP-(fatty) acid ligase